MEDGGEVRGIFDAGVCLGGTLRLYEARCSGRC